MYTRDNYNKVKNEIEARRTRAIAAADERSTEAALKSEDIKLIDTELRKTGLLLFKTACQGGDIAPIRERNELLLASRREALSRLGLPEDYTEPKYTCKKCSDTGYIGSKLCSCFKEMLITENIKSSGMGALIEKQSFENFNIDSYRDSPDAYERMLSNLNSAKEFAEHFNENGDKKTLVLLGKTGTGKTHISTAIAKRVIEQGFEVLYDSSQNIVSAFETDRFKSGYGPYEPKGDKYLECDLLIIDDLGTEFINQFTVSCLYNLLNTRQNKGLSTIISTNFTYKELLNKYEDRIFSRIVGQNSQILLFVGNDRRLDV